MFFGIDLRLASVSVLGMTIQDGLSLVTGWGTAPLAEDHFDGQSIKNIDGLAASIRDALVKANFKRNLKYPCASVAIPQEKIISKILPFSISLKKRELEDFALIKMAQYLPFPLSETYLDFAVLGNSLNQPGMQDVLIVASHQEEVNPRVEAIARAGVRVAAVDVDVFAAQRCLNWLQEEEIPEGQGVIKMLMSRAGPSPRSSATHSSAVITACGLALKGQRKGRGCDGN